MVTGNPAGVSYHDQVKNFDPVTGGWNKVEGRRVFSYFIFALRPSVLFHLSLFRFPSIDSPSHARHDRFFSLVYVLDHFFFSFLP